MASLSMIVVGYVALVALAGVFMAIGCWIAGLIMALLALGLAYRYELRWFLDHTPITRHKPRAVPKKPIGVK